MKRTLRYQCQAPLCLWRTCPDLSGGVGGKVKPANKLKYKRDWVVICLICNLVAMDIVFDDSSGKESLYPFTATRNAADIRIGILTIREKWALMMTKPGFNEKPDSITVNAAIIPTENYVATIVRGSVSDSEYEQTDSCILKFLWNIFQLNDWALKKDFELITNNRTSHAISSTNKTIAPENIFIEEGAIVEHSLLNASTGPIYIGKNAEVMEGCMIRGPFALCENAVLKMGAKVYGATTIGPNCIAAGEIKNSVLMANSNKAHDGYLGDSVLGEWCNLGAGTSNSNVKNTAGTVKAWNNATKEYIPVGLKAGLMMGDYSRAAINTSFNTGTVVGVCCNIFGEGFPPKFVNDFTWGKERYTFEKVLQDIDNWKKFKGQHITQTEINNLEILYKQST